MTSRKWKDAEYLDAQVVRSGEMVCCSCHKLIEGEYRSREADDAYINQHRECSEHDVVWSKRDAEKASCLALIERRKSAAIDFISEWGVIDLEEAAT